MNYARRIRQCSSCLIRCTNVLHLALGVICWFACVLHVRWIWFIAAVLGLYSVLSFLVRRKRKWTLDLVWVLVYLLTAATVFYCCAWSSTQMKLIKHDQPALRDWHEDCDRIPPFSSIIYSVQHTWEMFGCRSDEGGTPSGIRDEEKLPHTDLGRLFESISGDTSGASSAMLWDHQRLEVGSSLEPLGSPFLGKLRGTKDMPRVLDQPAARQSGRSRLATAGTFVSTHVSCTVTRWNPFDTHFVSKFESQINSICHVDIAEQDQTVYANGTEKCVNSTVLGLSGELRDIFCVCRVTIVSFYWRQFKILFGIFLVETILLIIDFVSHYLSILFSRREAWCKNRLQLRQNVFLQLAHEKLDPEEALVCKGNFDDRVVLWQVLCFLLISNVLLPVSLLILPCYLERKEREHVEQMLLVSDRRIISQKQKLCAPLVLHIEEVDRIELIPPPWQKCLCCCCSSDASELSAAEATTTLIVILKSGSRISMGAVKNGAEFMQTLGSVQRMTSQDGRLSFHLRRQDEQSARTPLVRDQSSAPGLGSLGWRSTEDLSRGTSSSDGAAGRLSADKVVIRLEGFEFCPVEEGHETSMVSMKFCCNGVMWTVTRPPHCFVKLNLRLHHKIVNLGPGVHKPRLPPEICPSLLREGLHPAAHSTALRHYVQDCLRVKEICEASAFRVFIEVSPFSFRIRGPNRQKLREGYVWKKCRSCRPFTRRRWLLLREDHLCYTHHISSEVVSGTFIFDESLRVSAGKEETGFRKGLIVQTYADKLGFICRNAREARLWQKAILEAKERCEYCRSQRFGGSSPLRKNCRATLLVDGAAHFGAVHRALREAKHSIYVSDWQLTATLTLSRSGDHDFDEKLVEVLKEKAEAGVQVFVVLYREAHLTMVNDSAGAASILKKAHPNINVLRHPRYKAWLWSHHEKVCIVDEQIGFVGGIDLCVGRYDTPQHPLFDHENVHPGQDYWNPIIRDFRSVREVQAVEQNLLNRANQPRMPWHDVAVMLEGTVCRDLARHYLQLWTHVKLDNGAASRHHGAAPSATSAEARWRNRPKQWLEVRSRRKYMRERGIPQGNPLSSEHSSDTVANLPLQSDFLPGRSPLVGAMQPPSGRLAAVSFQPGADQFQPTSFAVCDLTHSWHGEPMSLQAASTHLMHKQQMSFHVSAQLLRSASRWSYGLSSTESSIQSAYINLISTAQHYVYMENQYFVTSTHRDDGSPNAAFKNQIGKALADRVIKAAQMKEPFKVYIVMPLMPGFEAEDFKSTDAWICRKMMHYQFESLRSGTNSLIETLEDELPAGHWKDYVGVFCLLSLERAPDRTWHAGQIYVHSKVIIVDDTRAIVGSANVNDRSMIGERDSEVCVLIEDGPDLDQFESGLLGGEFRRTGKFCRNARLSLWHEHFGLLDGEHVEEKTALSDPSSELCWTRWRDVASERSKAFDTFGMWPTSAATTWHQWEKMRDQRKGAEASPAWKPPSVLNPPRGSPRPHVAEFPLNFLRDEDIRQPSPLLTRATVIPYHAILS
eukprot:TRINITY_DN10675_c0_g1_i3.p1 TRINITY_DN10675_c0_g1~~TRINITY_DN10675_c0_g1_i3.p1  ORF type:complete len:1513 (+),score=207.07 TRINITY_DN10675_c0_g1_i3:158-4696(+)